MKRTICSLLLFVLIFAETKAAVVSVGNAQNVAANFFKITFPNQVGRNTPAAVLRYTQTEPDGSVDFYVFDISNLNGFVIVSAHDELIPVLAYSNESYFITDFSQIGLADWINETAQQVHGVVLQHVAPDTQIIDLWTKYAQGINPGSAKSNSVGPLLTTTWNQAPYYNAQCPINPNDGQRSVTGCVATAMAQIMKYWNYPTQGVGSFSYVDDNAHGYQNNIGTLSANFATTTYQWAQMPNYLTGNNNAIGTLMSHCGISVAMDYSDGGSCAYVIQSEANSAYGYSGAPCAQHSYVSYFIYDPNTIRGVFQSNYTTQQWINLIEGEMDAGRVVQYEGVDPRAGGHTWVCDGYDVNNNLHMNWGWGGAANGYFNVNNLNAGGYAFNYRDAALIGIQPLYPAVDTVCTVTASFAYQNAGGSNIQFTNTSVSNHAFSSSWTFSNAGGPFTTSTLTNPLVTYMGQPPYSATLTVTDTFAGGCWDSVSHTIAFNPNTTCVSIQQGPTHTVGSDLTPFHPTQNFDFTAYPNFMSSHWTNGGNPTEDAGLLKFDLSQIPAGSVLVSAYLDLYADSISGQGYAGQPTYGNDNASYLHLVTSAWNPATVTWNTMPTSSNTNEVLLAQSTTTFQHYLNIDVSNMAQVWFNNPSANYGMLLQMITQNHYNSMIFCSPGHADSTKWPRLRVCYIAPQSCQANASFVQQNLGNGQMLFTNTSTSNAAYTSHWVFYDSTGVFATSNATDPAITFTGEPPYSVTLTITDSICSDSLHQLVSLKNCFTMQNGTAKPVGANIAPFHPTQNFDYTTYPYFMTSHWTNGGTPTEDDGLLKYDLSQIPVGSVIASAKLSLYVDNNAGQGYVGQPTYGTDNASNLYLITSAWDPATVTWNTQPTVSTNNAVLLPQSTSTSQNYTDLDISNFVQLWVNNPAANYGMLLKMIGQNHYNSMIFCSPGNADSTKWPELDICYLVASPCHISSSFTEQDMGGRMVQFTNTSTISNNILPNWTFYNSNGAFNTSTIANPLINYTGSAPFSATLVLTDTSTGCTDTFSMPFNVDVTSGILQAGDNLSGLSVYPNPNNGNAFTVRLPAGYDEVTNFKIFDAVGREVQYAITAKAAGFYQLTLNGAGATGIYTLVATNGWRSVRAKLVIVK